MRSPSNVDFPSEWNGLANGMQHGTVTIRRARPGDEAAVTRLLAIATSSDTAQLLAENAGALGGLVAAYHQHDEQAVRGFWDSDPHPIDVVIAGSMILVAEDAGRLVGAICLAVPWKIYLELEDAGNAQAAAATMLKLAAVGVKDTHRGRGIGHDLVATATRLADQAGYGVVFGQCSEDLRPFYEHAGYRTVDAGGLCIIRKGTAAVAALKADDPDERMFARIMLPVSVRNAAWRAPRIDPKWWQPAPLSARLLAQLLSR